MKMKSVLKLLGIVAAVAVIGFSMAGCDNNGGCGGCYIRIVDGNFVSRSQCLTACDDALSDAMGNRLYAGETTFTVTCVC